MASYVQKWITLPERYNQAQLDLIGDTIVEHIKVRTEKGHGKNAKWQGRGSWSGHRFPKYSKEYIDSLDFKIAGKSPQPVNLTLSGDMLAELDVLETSPKRIKIGYEEGSDEAARAEGNIRGTYGKLRGSTRKARDFLGIRQADVDKIVRRLAPELEDLE